MIKIVGIVLAPIVYPFAYLLRWKLRSRQILYPRYLYRPRNFLCIPLWLFLADAEVLDDTQTEYGDFPKYYPSWIWNSNSDFLKSYFFCAIRNSLVNFNNWFAKVYLKRLAEVYCFYRFHLEWSFLTDRFHSFGPVFDFELRLLTFLRRNGKPVRLPAMEVLFFKYGLFVGFAKSGRFWIEFKKS